MQKSMPVICCTDRSTDIGLIAESGNFGWNCQSNDPSEFANAVDCAIKADIVKMGECAAKYLVENYSVKGSVEIIMKEYEKVAQ